MRLRTSGRAPVEEYVPLRYSVGLKKSGHVQQFVDRHHRDHVSICAVLCDGDWRAAQMTPRLCNPGWFAGAPDMDGRQSVGDRSAWSVLKSGLIAKRASIPW